MDKKIIEERINNYIKGLNTLKAECDAEDKFKMDCIETLYEAYKKTNINLNNLILKESDKILYDIANNILYYNLAEDLEKVEYTLINLIIKKMIDTLNCETREDQILLMYDILYKVELIELSYEIIGESEEEMISILTELIIENER